MLPQLIQHPSNGFYMFFTLAFSINENIIKVHYHKNVELLCQDLADIILERGRYVGQSKKHDLVFEVAIASLKGRLLFVPFLNPYSMIGISQIKLDELSSPT